MLQNNEDNLISIDEVIFRAKSRGIDFGKGNPRERLRYLTKIGLLPHARRKSFNGQAPNGAYPEYVLELLKEIDEKIKAGKSIQEIKKEKERKSLVEVPYTYIIPPTLKEIRPPSVEVEPPIPQVEKEVLSTSRSFLKIASLLKIVFLVLIFGGIIFFLTSQVIREDFYAYFLASFIWIQKLAQLSPATVGERPETIPEVKEIFPPSSPESYLTINAETDINAPLNVKETISAPALSLSKGEFKGILTSSDLTADRIYTFPDLSGIVCLTTGNCIGIGGEVLSPGGTPNRLAKFISEHEIGDSSIEDLYTGGVALIIDSFGNIGIGTDKPRGKLDVAGKLITDGRVGIGIENPRYPLHVKGRIQATGDICTNLAGGRCLSTLALGGAPPPAAVPTVTGISGSGTTNYLSIWTSGTTLGNSIIYQDGSNVGIGTTSPSATLTLSGKAIFATTTLPQLVLRYDTDNYLNFAIDSSQSLIESSKKLAFNSLTGEIKFFSTSIKKGDKVLRSSVPIFKFPIDAQTTSTLSVAVSRQISTSTLNSILPSQLEGSLRKFAFLINFADDISTSTSSTWTIDFDSIADIDFQFQGQNLTSLDEGKPYLKTDITELLDDNWVLKVKVPNSSNRIRIFNIFLLVYDEIQ